MQRESLLKGHVKMRHAVSCIEPGLAIRFMELVPWDDPEGWYGEGGGRGVQAGEHMYACGRFMLMRESDFKVSNVVHISINS